MSVKELKDIIRTKLEGINDQVMLEQLLLSIETNEFSRELSNEERSLVEERHEAYKRGEVKGHTIEEFKQVIKQKYGF